MIPTLLAFLAPISIAWLCLAQCRPQPTQSQLGAAVYRGSLACGLGIGLSSCSFFLWLTFARSSIPSYWMFETVCGAGLLATCWQLRRVFAHRPTGDLRPVTLPATSSTSASHRSQKSTRARERLLALCVAVLAVCLTFVFIANQRRFPEGVNDAIGIWNLHARVILLDPNWTKYFSESRMWSHTDYPLLLPASVARLWLTTGQPSGLAPALIAYAFTAATIGLCSGYVAMRRGCESGLLCALALLGCSFLIKHGGNQYADVPLAFYIAAALTGMSQHFATEHSMFSRYGAVPHGAARYGESRYGESRYDQSLVLAGLLAALGGWTKNEGLLFLVCFFAVLALASLLRSRPNQAIRRGLSATAAAAVGAAGIVLLIVYFKLTIAPQNDLIAGQDASDSLTRIFTLQRYQTVAIISLLELTDVVKVMLPALVVFTVCMGWHRGTGQRLDLWLWSGTLAMVVLGYVFVYVITPHPLEWHVTSSVRRLFLQLWPAALSGLFLSLASPRSVLEPAVPDDSEIFLATSHSRDSHTVSTPATVGGTVENSTGTSTENAVSAGLS